MKSVVLSERYFSRLNEEFDVFKNLKLIREVI